jgi:hypothetical protein
LVIIILLLHYYYCIAVGYGFLIAADEDVWLLLLLLLLLWLVTGLLPPLLLYCRRAINAITVQLRRHAAVAAGFLLRLAYGYGCYYRLAGHYWLLLLPAAY